MLDWLNQYYYWIKALHVISVIAWMSGMFYLPRLFVYHCEAVPGSPESERFKVMERKLLRIITNPAMVATWIFGLMLSFLPATDAWHQPWFHAKFLLVLVMIGSYSSENNPMDVLFVFVFGALGVAMERYGYNRPALLLGFVLGETIERYYQVSMNAYGPTFFMRPISLAIIAVTLACVFWPNRMRILRYWGYR